ncbi:hypothetical protein GGD57_001983 [Rhizobium esperanzae]|uniref:Uncharacterized protein n=1 Tax=Rhizobium esperanzae TaxID=1967781 RepID=A0A7W6W4K5_9HYPH|nr:hypothetical protein [Rhizobium esperanzae]
MPDDYQRDPKPPGDEITKAGALADGFANGAVNSTEVDNGSTGYVGLANSDDRGNTDNGVDVTANADIDVSANSGFYLELVRGANLLSNTVDSSVFGGNSRDSDIGEDGST